MKLHSLRTRGVGMPFRSSEVTIDFDALGDAKLVALVGGNGEGKSTCLELSGPATLFRTFPSYGNESLADHVAPGVRDAFAELVFSLGPDRFRAMVQCDPSFGGGRGKTEALLSRQVGSEWTPVAGPLVREYDEAIGKILPSKDLFLASVFACQGGEGSFFGLAKADRKSLFSSMLGLAHLQEKSELSRGRGQNVLLKLARVREDIEAAEARAERCRALVAAIETKTEALAALDAQLASARKSVEAAQARLAAANHELSTGEAEAAATSRERARVEAERDQAQQKVGALTVRLEQIAEALGSADQVRSAAARLARIDEELRQAQDAERAAAESLRPVDAQIATLEAQRAALVADHKRVSAELEAARAAEIRAASAVKLEQDMAAQQEQLERAIAAIDDCTARKPDLLSAARGEQEQILKRRTLTASRDELSPRTGLLSQVPGVPECEGCPLTSDARRARDRLAEVERELSDLPVIDGTPAADALRALEEKQVGHEAERRRAHAWIIDHAPKLAQLAQDRDAAAGAPALEAALACIAADGADIRARLDEAREQQARHAGDHSAAARRTAELTKERAALVDTAGKLERIAAGEAQKAEIEAALGTAKGDAMAATAALAELTDVEVAPLRDRVTSATLEAVRASERLEVADGNAALVRGELAKLSGERDALGAPADELAALRAREETLVRDAGDWALLEKALGRDGIQALAIDAAGPAVSALANDLLSACYGPRFSLSLETTAQTKDGKKQREVFDIRILDAEAGREAKQGSGGEMVLIEEGLRLALAIFNTQRSGIPLRTLWRDETTGALSPENADRYVSMLRRAMELGGFERCLFIAHAEAVWQQADARIFIANGAVSFDEQRDAA